MTHAPPVAPATTPVGSGVYRWRTGWLVWPVVGLTGFFAIIALSLASGGSPDGEQESVGARIVDGLVAAVLGYVAVRAAVAGIFLDGVRVRVRGAWRTRTLLRSEVAG